MSERSKRRRLNPQIIEPFPNQSPSHANIENIPDKILLQIITRLPGLETLWNLLAASPRCFRLFNSQPHTIIEQLFASPTSILPPKIQELVRAVILTRSGALLFKNLDEFKYRFIQHKVPVHRIKDKTNITLGPDTLTTHDIQPSVYLSAVATAHHISALAHACLSFYLPQIHNPDIFHPQHAQLPLPKYLPRGSNPPEGDTTPAWHQVFFGLPYDVVDAGPPSWVEEMRVVRALWVIQLVGGVRCLVLKDLNASGWSYDDINRTLPKYADAVPQDGTMNSGAEEIQTVLAYLEKLGITNKGEPFYQLPKLPLDAKPVNPVTPLPDPCEATWGGIGIIYDYGHKTVKLRPPPSALQRASGPQLSKSSLRGQARSSLENESPAVTTLRHYTDGNSRYGLPITNARMDIYRPFGLALWDRWRLCLLGLLGEGRMDERDLDYYCFAWESLMDEEWVRHVRRVLREGVRLEGGEGVEAGSSSEDDDDEDDDEDEEDGDV
ncbi:uncharacterized protein TRIREDRAFT_112267 [Trichoderma reesei QM6a]|uniref:Predicted protein n=2 Tax=Hypocrea jecorina TaxID=51453 RepID=G0RWM2_HYPJQ|nr:uncharacterized protein TRIREDRAFT_112267 [Trichoderma reesei QM6a]EGR44458.1 predicted protein [Trichoderma reesei QM6a]ETR97097.1 hypothetical protein M419DRAFT_92383 [Trichoderma reesei RUT C-30]